MAGAHCQHHQLDLLVVVVPLEVCGVEALTPGIRGPYAQCHGGMRVYALHEEGKSVQGVSIVV